MRKRKAFDDQASAAEIAGAASAEAAYLAVHEEEEHLPPGTDLTAAAFFDVDNTMMQGASIFHFARGLVARNFFTTGDLLRFALLQIKFRLVGEDADDTCGPGRGPWRSSPAGRSPRSWTWARRSTTS